MKLLTYTLIIFNWTLLVQTSRANDIITPATNLIELTDEDYEQFLEKHSDDTVLALFYSPWCYWSEQLMREYSVASNIASSQYQDVFFTHINAHKQRNVSRIEQIKAYPTLKMFIHGESMIYEGRRRSAELINWVEVISKRDKIITNVEQLISLISHTRLNYPVIIGSFPGTIHKNFGSVAKLMGESIIFGEIRDQDTANELFKLFQDQLKEHSPSEPTILSITTFDDPNKEKIVVYTGNIEDIRSIEDFVKLYRLPSLVPMNKDYYTQLHTDGRPILIFIYRADQNDMFEADKSMILLYREQYKHSMIFSYSFDHTPFQLRIINLLGLEDETLPAMRIISINPKTSNLLKFKPETSAIDPNAIHTFITSYLNHQLKSYVNSELETSQDPSDPVKTLVGDNFDDIARSPDNDVLVLFHAPWCGHCREFEPTYREVARLLKSTPHIFIAKIDATANEIRDVDLVGYPTVKLYRAEKDHNGIEYNGSRSVKPILNWLAQMSKRANFNPDTLAENIDVTLGADFIEL